MKVNQAYKSIVINVLSNLNLMNIILPIFYLHKGATDQILFVLPIIFGFVIFFLEPVSSIWADKYGRRRVVIIGLLFSALRWILLLFFNGPLVLYTSILFHGFSYAMLSGTDEALFIELVKQDNANEKKMISIFYASKMYSRIITPIIAGVIGATVTSEYSSKFLLLSKLAVL